MDKETLKKGNHFSAILDEISDRSKYLKKINSPDSGMTLRHIMLESEKNSGIDIDLSRILKDRETPEELQLAADIIRQSAEAATAVLEAGYDRALKHIEIVFKELKPKKNEESN